ncbi:hypothetical protein LCGC14_2403490, partial [marine sediment metagenome]
MIGLHGIDEIHTRCVAYRVKNPLLQSLFSGYGIQRGFHSRNLTEDTDHRQML